MALEIVSASQYGSAKHHLLGTIDGPRGSKVGSSERGRLVPVPQVDEMARSDSTEIPGPDSDVGFASAIEH